MVMWWWLLCLLHLIIIIECENTLFDKAVELHQSGDINNAFELYQSIYDNASRIQFKGMESITAQTLHNMALISHSEKKGSSSAFQLLEESIQLDPLISNTFNTQGGLYNELGEFDKAVESYRTAIEIDPNIINYHLGIAAVYHYGVALKEVSADDALSAACHHYDVALKLGDDTLSVASKIGILNDLSIALSKQGRQKEVVSVLKKAVDLDPQNIQSLGNYAIALREVGDLFGSMQVVEAAVQLAPDDVRMRFNYGLILQSLERGNDASKQWKICLKYDPSFYPALESLGHYEGAQGDPDAALRYYESALLAADKLMKGNIIGVMSGQDALKAIGGLKLMVATSCVPPIFADNKAITRARTLFSNNLISLLQQDKEENLIHSPMTSLGSGSLGYYLIYTGHNDVHIRRLLASVYWKFAPSLMFTAPFLNSAQAIGHATAHSIQSRIHIGFISSFFYRHSVGLLTEGIITGLSAKVDQFHVSLIYPTPHADLSDTIYQRLIKVVHRVIEIPKGNLFVARSIIAAEKVDVLVYAEVLAFVEWISQ